MIFGSVSAADIKDALDKLGFEIEKKKIVLDEPIKRLGNYTIPVKVFHDDKAALRVEVRRKRRPAKRRSPKKTSKARAKGKSGSGGAGPVLRLERLAMELDLMFLKKTPPHSLEAEKTVLGGSWSTTRTSTRSSRSFRPRIFTRTPTAGSSRGSSSWWTKVFLSTCSP